MTDTFHRSKLPETVLACSLSGGEQVDRARWLKRLSEQALGVSSRSDGVSVEFPASEGIEGDVRALATAEAQCCPFLRFEINRTGDRVELVVGGPPEARPMIETMFEVQG